MTSSDPIDILLAHDRWATTQIIGACEKLSPEQFHRKFEMGPGSLHATLTHMISAMRTWTDVLAAREVRPRPDQDGQTRTVAELAALHNAAADEFAQFVRAHPFDGLVTRHREGKTFTFPRGVVFTQVTTHGMHHRAQCLNMLRHLGAAPLPLSSVVEWSRFAD